MQFAEAYKLDGGHFYLKFDVSGLSDRWLVYLVDNQGNLVNVYIDSPYL